METIAVTGLDHLTLKVRDLQKSLEFYQQVFNFEMKEDATQEQDPWAIIGIPNKIYLCLYQYEDCDTSNNSIFHWGFNVGSEIHATSKKLQKLGVPVQYLEDGNDGVVDYPHSKSLYISDPDGYEIELSSLCGGGLN